VCQTTCMGFSRTALLTAVEGVGSGDEGALAPSEFLQLPLNDEASESFGRSSRQPRAVLCGSYRRGIPSLLAAYEKLSAAGVSVLSPSGIEFIAEIDGYVLNRVGIPLPKAVEGLRLNCIRAADLVWLHAPGGYVGLSGALEIGFANAVGTPVYAEEMPSDDALCSLVTVSPLDDVIAETSSGENDNSEPSPLSLQENQSSAARDWGYRHKSAQEIMMLITEEIEGLARQNPGQRQQRSCTS